MERSVQTIQLLEASLREQGLETALDDSLPGCPGMCVLIPLPDDGIQLRTELHYVSCGELFDVLQLYTTIADALTDHDMRELGQAVNVWNFSVVLGALAVREDHRTLYHRYSLALAKELSAEQCAVVSESVLTSILQSIAPVQADILTLLSGITFEQLQQLPDRP